MNIIVRKLLDKLLCSVCLHKWEQGDLFDREPLRRTGPDILFHTGAIQVGTQYCQRELCIASRRAYSTGMFGTGGIARKWERLNSERETEIGSYPKI